MPASAAHGEQVPPGQKLGRLAGGEEIDGQEGAEDGYAVAKDGQNGAWQLDAEVGDGVSEAMGPVKQRQGDEHQEV